MAGGGAKGGGQQHQQRQRCPGEWLGHRAKGRLQGDGADTNAHVADEEDEVVKRRGRTSFELPAARPSAGVGFGLNWIDLSQTPPPRHSGVSEYQAGEPAQTSIVPAPKEPPKRGLVLPRKGKKFAPHKIGHYLGIRRFQHWCASAEFPDTPGCPLWGLPRHVLGHQTTP